MVPSSPNAPLSFIRIVRDGVGRRLKWYHVRVGSALLLGSISRRTRRLIVFLTPGYQWRAGGVLSIASLYRESVRFSEVHGARVVLATVPGDPHILKYTWFKNRNYIMEAEAVLRRCRQLDFLMLHIPEYAVNRVVDWLTLVAPRLLTDVREVHLNILLQNIDQIQGQDVSGLLRFGTVTCTTAHESYTNKITRESLGVPLHRLSTCVSPEQYSRSSYAAKESLLVVSPDEHPLKERVLGAISQALPELRIQIIRDLSYEDYRRLIRRAKWSLTFGEGLDAYFIEPMFSGAVSFATFNDRYFTPEFASLETVYPSWEILLEKLPSDLRRLDDPKRYEICWQRGYDLLAGIYRTDHYRENLRQFYRGNYTFP
jgi:hypothetical protein